MLLVGIENNWGDERYRVDSRGIASMGWDDSCGTRCALTASIRFHEMDISECAEMGRSSDPNSAAEDCHKALVKGSIVARGWHCWTQHFSLGTRDKTSSI